MTLSLDDIQAKRFRITRRSGYEVAEVDEFVDEVESTVSELTSENDNLKRQIEALQVSDAGAVSSAGSGAGGAAATQRPAGSGLVVTTSKEASAAVVRLVELSTEQAERVVAEANDEADRIREDAERVAHQVTTDAAAHAERLESEARLQAERLQSEATARSEQAERELAEWRRSHFGELEAERERLSAAVADLRRFEASFRENLTSHLYATIEHLESGHTEPVDAPTPVLSAPRPAEPIPSDTPRLDALVRDES